MMLCAPAGPCGHVGGHVGASMTRRISSPLPVGPKRVTSFARVVAHPRRRPCDHYRHRADRSTRPCRARDRPPGRGGSDPGVESRCVPRVGARARRHDVGILADPEGNGRTSNTQKCPCAGEKLEAAGGVEPPMEILQTSALPLGYAAPAQASLTTEGRRQSTKPMSSAHAAKEIGAGEGTRTLDLLHGKQTL